MAPTNKSSSTSKGKKTGPKDGSYVNKKQDYEVEYAPKRKTAPLKFGSKQK